MTDIQEIKQRFGIIGNAHGLNRAIEVAIRVAPTDLSVLINGESGVGKEVFPQIIHSFSARKHGKYIPVNCGAIPEGTIDSELFGHEKGAFTGALSDRKGYFENGDGGTIFLDEVGELPLSTQVRLLRVLETGEFIRVGSSKVQKTNVRVVAATNVDIPKAISENKFREDLYYRLNTVPVYIPPLRERREDIVLLFRKFAYDFAEKYRMPPVRLNESAQHGLVSFTWPGNIRQLKNVTEQVSIIEQNRDIDITSLQSYLPTISEKQLPAIYHKQDDEKSFGSEREILYQVLFDMKKDMGDLKKLVLDLMKTGSSGDDLSTENQNIIRKLYDDENTTISPIPTVQQNNDTPAVIQPSFVHHEDNIEDTEEFIEESLSLEEKEKELIVKALDKYNGKRKYASKELGISERTLYRKIKEYDIK